MTSEQPDRRALRDELADVLDAAQTGVRDVESLSDTSAFDLDDAYAIQEALTARRLARGERLVGVKMGFTSRAKMAQMGVAEVIVGRLTDAMHIGDGGEVDLSRFIHPRIEPEVAYRVGPGFDLSDPDSDLAEHVDAIAPAMEIIDSRYRDFRFTHEDVVADNTSAAAFVVGPWQPVVDAAEAAVRISVGEQESTGSTAAILDDPMNAVREAQRMCRKRGLALVPGDVVLAGAATAALPLGPVHAECEIEGLGTVSVSGVRGLEVQS
ncbi:4-oxalocrotonate decarboxylase [Rhodococcus rhodnii]|uniref:2-hydroxypentadienoate hydratase n=2 Tax=Rhodococcus rhodnii TaxID=38312 RepID=R7WJR8_9NOCA|nr:fumarylacetoacetate hydrolase family protein [Rhodococcus rhodnii]EOM75525.1 2-hydroxypentadienoate hydratase [Rhodococcus rhodnii LMG 5362]TXG90469.1 4-oxalocrotonate decarboxylase [Rhodococcus rhodnii]